MHISREVNFLASDLPIKLCVCVCVFQCSAAKSCMDMLIPTAQWGQIAAACACAPQLQVIIFINIDKWKWEGMERWTTASEGIEGMEEGQVVLLTGCVVEWMLIATSHCCCLVKFNCYISSFSGFYADYVHARPDSARFTIIIITGYGRYE